MLLAACVTRVANGGPHAHSPVERFMSKDCVRLRDPMFVSSSTMHICLLS